MPKKLLNITETAEGLSIADPIDGRARCTFGAKGKHSGKLGPAWRAQLFTGPRHPNGLSITLSDPDWDEISKPLAKASKANGDEHFACSKRKKNSRGKWQAADIAINLGSTEITWTWPTLADVPEPTADDPPGYCHVDLLIDAPDMPLTWAKQPALTEEEIAAGHSRTENVVNSYAVYSPFFGRILTPAGDEIVNYETGKVCHVYRPQLVDANGNTLWCDQSAPLGSPPRLRIYLPLAWLAAATFPVILDPTFGYTSMGSFDFGGAYVMCQTAPAYTVGAAGTITQISIATQAAAGNVPVAVYAMSSLVPGNQLGNTTVSVSSTKAWYHSGALSWSMSAGTDYCVAAGWNVANVQYDSLGASYKRNYKAQASLPNPWGTGTADQGYGLSYYATYTEAAASGGAYRLLNGLLRGGQLAGGKLIGGR